MLLIAKLAHQAMNIAAMINQTTYNYSWRTHITAYTKVPNNGETMRHSRHRILQYVSHHKRTSCQRYTSDSCL